MLEVYLVCYYFPFSVKLKIPNKVSVDFTILWVSTYHEKTIDWGIAILYILFFFLKIVSIIQYSLYDKKIYLPMQEPQETQTPLLGQENPLKLEMATLSSILARKIIWAEVGCSPWEFQRARHSWVCTNAHTQLSTMINK